MRWPAPLRPLYVQVLLAIAAAIVVGMVWPETGRAMKPLGDGFIALLKVLIGPIIFTTVVLGFTQIRDLGKLGRVVLKAFLYFEVVSTLALAVGLVAGNVFEPGAGLHATGPATGSVATSIAGYQASAAKAGGMVQFLLALIPKTFVSAFAEGEILQILILSILFGMAAVMLAEKSPRTLELLAEMQRLFFRMLGFVMKLAPIGAFGAMAYTVGTHGGATLLSLLKLVLLVYGSCLFFVLVVLGGIAASAGLSIFKILRMIREEILIVLGTSSSEVVLPRLLEKLESAGCDKSVVGLVVPAGYSFNTDGTAIYMSMAVVFISQATDTPLDLWQQLGILAILLFTSKGGAAVSGAGFVKLAATLQSVPSLPMSGLGVLIGVDRFMSEARSITNMIGNTVATLVIARWENAFDRAKFDRFVENPVLREEKPEETVTDAGALRA
ncbi:MAG: C4-dicarboxylate transporter DctA [Azospirillum brasilense]|nr:MAG: C4-dicarboxylate transporter DctA [Azospirillum brasilense]